MLKISTNTKHRHFKLARTHVFETSYIFLSNSNCIERESAMNTETMKIFSKNLKKRP